MLLQKYIARLIIAVISLIGSNLYAQSCADIFTAQRVQQSGVSPEQLREIERLLREFAFELKKLDSIFGENKTAKTYTELAQQSALINQLDSRLYQRDIIRQNGGLCGTACSVNAMAALYKISPIKFREVAPSLMQMIVDLYTEFVKFDARFGTRIEDQQRLFDLFFPLGEKHFSTLGLYAPHIVSRLIPANESFISSSLQRDSIIIASISPVQNASSFGVHRSHAVIVLKLDAISKKIYISDPNNPNLIRRENYSVGSDGYIYTYAQTTYGQQLVKIKGALLFAKD